MGDHSADHWGIWLCIPHKRLPVYTCQQNMGQECRWDMYQLDAVSHEGKLQVELEARRKLTLQQ